MTKCGFTLVELLVVVAVVALLAAIAVPSLLTAQTRSKVSRVRADLATLRTALEAYAVDQGYYPSNGSGFGLQGDLVGLLTPVAYLNSLPNDPFTRETGYFYMSVRPSILSGKPGQGDYLASSAGPDRVYQSSLLVELPYDPTNGTVSAGDISISRLQK